MPAKVDVLIRRETAELTPWQTVFVAQVDLGEGLTRRERTILYNCARLCEVHKLLNGEMTFEYQLAGQ